MTATYGAFPSSWPARPQTNSGAPIKVLSVFGTRPEAIKMAMVVRALGADPQIESRVCVTGQHRQMLDQVLEAFSLRPDHDLAVMTAGQSLPSMTRRLIEGLERAMVAEKPDWVLVQGDTTTAFAGALSAFYNRAMVGHIEAGLRTGDLAAPWPEEGNRRLITPLARLHFAPTEQARANLLAENVPAGHIHVTGNTVIDALQHVSGRLAEDASKLADEMAARFPFLDPARRLILVTGHRRENFDGGLERVCQGLRRLAERPDVQIVYAVHLNPKVRGAVGRTLGDLPSVHLIEPQDYLPFVYLMTRASLIVTDSGGIQEEAPSIKKPVLVTREVTERPEAVAEGAVRLVGTSAERVFAEATRLLDDPAAYAAMTCARNPYGDGRAAERILTALKEASAGARVFPLAAPVPAAAEEAARRIS